MIKERHKFKKQKIFSFSGRWIVLRISTKRSKVDSQMAKQAFVVSSFWNKLRELGSAVTYLMLVLIPQLRLDDIFLRNSFSLNLNFAIFTKRS